MKQTTKLCIGTLLILALMMPGMLSGTGTDDVYARMRTAYKGINTYQAAVTQSNYYPQLKKTIQYTGKMYFSGGRMLMSFDKPHIQRLHIESGKVQLYDSLSNTIFRGTILPQFGRMNPLEILQVYWERSTVSITGTKGENVSVRLVPVKDPMLKSLGAVINKKTGLVQTLSYQDSAGNSVTYAFSKIKLNSSIPAGVWSFTYPKDAQVIER